MGTSSQMRLHGILLPSGTWITSLDDTTPANNIEHFSAMASGDIVPSFRGAHGSRPDIRFTTPQIKDILDECGMTGLDMSSANCDLYYRNEAGFGGPDGIAELAHMRIRCVRGFLFWDEVSATQGQTATISCRIIPTFDGTNVPLTALGSQAIPAEFSSTTFHGLGPIEMSDGGSFLDDIQDWRLSLNPQIKERGSNGDAFTSFVGIETHDPVVTATTGEFARWTDIGPGGLAFTSLDLFLRKRTADGTANVADATAEHIKFVADAGLATIEQSSTDSINLRFGIRRNDYLTTYPITENTVSAIATGV